MPRLTSEKWKLELCGGLCPALQSYLLPVPLPVHQGDGPHLGAQQEGRMGAGWVGAAADGSGPHPLEAGVSTAVGQSLLQV